MVALHALALIGCADEERPGRPAATLAAMDAWRPGASAEPFAEDRPGDGACASGTRVEGSTFEIDTGTCTWLWVEQPLLAPVAEGDPLELVFWHGPLDAAEPAEAHLGLVIDGRIAHERWIAIPHDADAWTEAFPAPADAAAGRPLALHLHNHGTNTWNVLRIDRVDAGDPTP